MKTKRILINKYRDARRTFNDNKKLHRSIDLNKLKIIDDLNQINKLLKKI